MYKMFIINHQYLNFMKLYGDGQKLFVINLFMDFKIVVDYCCIIKLKGQKIHVFNFLIIKEII